MRKGKWLLYLLVAFMLIFSIASMVQAQDGWTIVSNELDVNTSAEEIQLVTLTWETELPSNLTVRVAEEVAVTAKSATAAEGGCDIEKALFIIEVTDNGSRVGPETFKVEALREEGEEGYEGPLGWDEDGEFFYYGSRDGFFMKEGYGPVTTTFEVTALEAGEFNVKIYTVELD